jgi:hypothetical protein
MTLYKAEESVQKDYKALWPLARRLCRSLSIISTRADRRFEANVSASLSLSWIKDSEEMWQTFIARLDDFVQADIAILVVNFLIWSSVSRNINRISRPCLRI